jgi:hypothetical protein
MEENLREDTVSNALTIVDKIPEAIREEFDETSRKVSPAILLEIARTGSADKQRRMWDRAKNGRLTVRQARAARSANGAQSQEAPAAERPTRESITVENATVTVQCESSATLEEIREFLQQASSQWEGKLRHPASER